MNHPRGLSWLRRSVVASIAAVALSAALVGCGSSDKAATDDAKGTGELTVALAGAIPLFSWIYLAESEGFYAEQGIKVKFIENSSANTANLIVSGKADLAVHAVGVPLIIAKQGKKVTLAYNMGNQLVGAAMVGGKSVTSIDQLKGARIGTLARGSGAWGTANQYNKTLELNADLVPFPDNASLAAAVSSGQVAAAVGPQALLAPVVDKAGGHMLISVAEPADVKKYVGKLYSAGAIFGLTDTLKSKRADVVKMLKAILQARAYFEKTDDLEIAKRLRTFPAFQTVPEAQLAKLVATDRVALQTSEDPLTEADWKFALSNIGGWGLEGFDPKSSVFSYKNMIDTSYLEAAIDGDGK